jgi:tetratricopeptide (TPR) repeat protein
LLGRAAVVGLVFYAGAVAELSPDGADIGKRIQQLVRRDLVRPDRSDLPGEEAFRFHHGLLRDAAYQMLPKEARADLHERFATWLGTHQGMVDADEFIGYHLERAHAYRLELGPEDERSRGLAERAAERLSAAARRAYERADNAATEVLARRSAALWNPDDPRRAWDLIALGSMLISADHAQEAQEAFGEALRIARANGDERCEAHALLGEASARGLVDPEGSSAEIAALIDRLLPRFEEWGDERGLGVAYFLRSQLSWNSCEFARAREFAAMGLPHARAAGDGMFERSAIVTRVIAGTLGPSSVEQIMADVDELESMALPSVRGLTFMSRSAVLAFTGRYEEARRMWELGRDALREIFGHEPAGPFESRWRIETVAGDAEAALEYIRIGYDRLMSYGDLAHASTSAVNLAISSYDLGRYDDAWRWAEECRRMSASDDAINQYQWRAVEAKLHAREGRFDEADVLIAEAVELSDRTDEFLGRSLVAFAEAEIAVMAGHTADAMAALRRALALAEQKGATAMAERARQRMAELDAR